MAVKCWSASERQVEVHQLPLVSGTQEVELISLGAFPIPMDEDLLVWGKLSFNTEFNPDADPSEHSFFVSTALYDSRLHDDEGLLPQDIAWCEMHSRFPGSQTVCRQAAIHAPAPALMNPRHRLMMRTARPNRPLEARWIWLSAIPLTAILRQPGSN